jgi:hypothetical protein
MRDAEYSPLASRVNLSMAAADMGEEATWAIKTSPDHAIALIFRLKLIAPACVRLAAQIRDDLLTVSADAHAGLSLVKVAPG